MKEVGTFNVPLVMSLPASGRLFQMVGLQTDGHVYRWNGTTWVDMTASGGGPTFTAPEKIQRADQIIESVTLYDKIQRADKMIESVTLNDKIQRGDAALMTASFAAPDKIQRGDLATFTVALSAVSRSGSPDSDQWGDGWTDSSLGQTGVNHGNETPLQFGNVTVGTKLAYLQIDLTKFTGLTATGNSHPLVFNMVNNDAGSATFQFSAAGQAGKPFTESTLAQSNQPATPTAITRTPTAAVGANTITVTLTDAEMQQLLGKWVLIVLGKSFAGTNAWTTPSREDATPANRMKLTFTVKV